MAKILGDALDWIKRLPPKSTFKQLFLETRLLLIPIMSGNAESPAEGLKDLECEQGAIANRPPIPYVAPVDPYKKQEKTKIKVKLPDRKYYQMVPFRAGSNEDYVNHIIAMIQLIQQKDLEISVEKVFVAASDIGEKIGLLRKKRNMSKYLRRRKASRKRSRLLRKILRKQRKRP
jgi:hypothetical protein